MEVADRLKKQNKSPVKAGPGGARVSLATTSLVGGKRREDSLMPGTPADHEAAAKMAKKRKQKIISTGGGRAFNPKERLYCICKTPYEDTK